MAPKTPKAPSDRPYGLNDNEVNVALHACKLLAEDGKIDNEKLAKLTGHSKAHTAYCAWHNVKKKIFAADDEAALTPAKSTASSPGGAAGSPTTPTAGKKRGRPSQKKEPAAAKLEAELDGAAEGEQPLLRKRTKMEDTVDAEDDDGLI